MSKGLQSCFQILVPKYLFVTCLYITGKKFPGIKLPSNELKLTLAIKNIRCHLLARDSFLEYLLFLSFFSSMFFFSFLMPTSFYAVLFGNISDFCNLRIRK